MKNIGETNIRVKLQNIRFNDFVEIESTREMYYRSNASVITNIDGSALLMHGEGFDCLTYFNSFAIDAWRKYTDTHQYYMVFEAKGEFNIDLVGHLPVREGRQKEWGGRFHFDLPERQEIVIPIPNTMESKVVAFGIIIYRDTTIYNAYYATEISSTKVRSPFFSILTRVTDPHTTIIKNINKILTSEKNNAVYKNHIDITVIDEDDLLQNRIIAPNVDYICSINNYINKSSKDHYIIWIDEHIDFDTDSLQRMYMLISLLKEEYTSLKIVGEAFKAEEKNLQAKFVLKQTAKKKNYTDFSANITLLDMRIWSSVIDNESGFEEERERYIPEIFYAVPSQHFCPDLFIERKDTSGTGYGLFSDPKDIIHMSGICAWVFNIRQLLEASKRSTFGNYKFAELQKIIVPGAVEIEVTKYMYYRSNAKVYMCEDGTMELANGANYDFFTYFNALSLAKWRRYTYTDNVYLSVEASGHFQIVLFGHYKSKIGYQKEWLGEYDYHLNEREKILIPYPRGMQSDLVAFAVRADDRCRIYNAAYVTDICADRIKNPRIALSTTTFKKESFIYRNIELLTDHLLEDPNYSNHYRWYIVDNGRSVEQPDNLNPNIEIIPNNNTGGAGGFSRGAIEALSGDFQPTHILFMDDDVVFIPDSFKRLCNLLSLLKDEYSEYFVSGAMLKIGQPNVQHENTGWMNEQGYNEPVNTNYDLNLWNVIIDNEEYKDTLPNRYAAFWFCCIPTSICRLDNLPLPVFFRGDDIEYSLRNHAKLITMNGLCIWHEGFEGRFNAFLDYYLTIRNKLMLCAINPSLDEINPIDHILINFWEEIHKFNYKGASFFLDAIEDFMKGPEFYKNTDGESNMKEKRKLDNVMSPMNPEIRTMVDYPRLYEDKYISDSSLDSLVKTHNFQDCSDEKNIEDKVLENSDSENKYHILDMKYQNKKSIGIIPYGWGSWPGKVYKMNEIIAVDPSNDTYTRYKKSVKQYKKLVERYEKLINYYENNIDRIKKDYQASRNTLTGETFWKQYLHI